MLSSTVCAGLGESTRALSDEQTPGNQHRQEVS